MTTSLQDVHEGKQALCYSDITVEMYDLENGHSALTEFCRSFRPSPRTRFPVVARAPFLLVWPQRLPNQLTRWAHVKGTACAWALTLVRSVYERHVLSEDPSSPGQPLCNHSELQCCHPQITRHSVKLNTSCVTFYEEERASKEESKTPKMNLKLLCSIQLPSTCHV